VSKAAIRWVRNTSTHEVAPLRPAARGGVSERKAYTAAALDMKTADMTPLAATGQALHTLASVAGGRHTVLGGGLPLHIGGHFYGGVGVSGGTTEQDIEIIEAAVNQLLLLHDRWDATRPPAS
jgi:uncharacterized protein GlcG (DUF336 family)